MKATVTPDGSVLLDGRPEEIAQAAIELLRARPVQVASQPVALCGKCRQAECGCDRKASATVEP